jgi:hypothetical protein
VNICPQHTATFRDAAPVSRRFMQGLTVTMVAIILLSLGASAALAQSAVPLISGPLVPDQKAPGSAKFTLTVNGTGFASDAVVNWNGSALVTTFVKSSQLTAAVTAANVAAVGTASVTVSNGGVLSNAAFFQIEKGGYTTSFSKQDFATDITPQDVTAADFNGDGQLDLAVATSNNSVSVLIGNGTGSFPTHVQYPVPGAPSAIIHGDFNGDGKMDVATADQNKSEITVLLGNGDGTLQTHQEFATGTEPVGLATADVNGDGKLDIVVVNLKADTVSVLIGNGDGTFKPHVDYGTGNGPSGVVIGDFNGDGKLDLAVANNTDATVAILFGNGDGTFQVAVPYPTAVGPNSLAVGDFNADGILDLAVGTSNKSISVLLGNPDGTFQNHKEYGIGANAQTIATADVNSDGKLDLISGNFNDNTVSTLVGNGDGTFKAQSIFPTNSGPSGLAVGDFNDDGKLDIAVADATGATVSVLTDSFIIVSPNVISFGTQTSGFPSAAKTITLRNNGPTPYTVPAAVLVGTSKADFTTTTTCGATLAAAGTCTYSIVFDPTASELANVQFLLTSANGSVVGAQLTGSGNIPITLSPRTMTFPFQLIGTTSVAKVDTFTNASGVDIFFTKIDLEGVNQNDFAFTTTCGNNNGVALAPGASCTSSITYSPTVTGGETTTQVYYGNFTQVKQGVLISGQGTAVKVTPTTVAFPNTTVGVTSAAKVVTFQNAGSTPLALSSVGWTGTKPYFAQTNTCNFPGGSIPANSSCTFSITFTPQAAGAFTATLSIGDPDPTGPQKVTVSGTGVAAN